MRKRWHPDRTAASESLPSLEPVAAAPTEDRCTQAKRGFCTSARQPWFQRRAGLRRQRGRGPPRRRRTHPTASGDSVHRQARDGKQTFVGPARPALPEAAVDQALADRPRWGVEQALAEVRLRRGWARPSDLTCRQRTARRMIGFVSRPARSSRAQWRHVDRRVRWARLYESGGVPRVVDAEQANVGL